ncbi:hypothetical protein GCM10010464_27470 [Pseudonocardia yunnanensis]
MIAEAIDEPDREVSVDSSIVRAHRHAAGARKAATAQSSPGRGRLRGDGELAPENVEFGDRFVNRADR